MTSSAVFITDHAWPDLEIEREVIEGAGLRMVASRAGHNPCNTLPLDRS